jgi:predicted hydrocarbon binding protein
VLEWSQEWGDGKMQSLRDTLGDFSSIVCFKAVVVGVEDTLGVQAAGVALKRAGRERGKALAASLGLSVDASSLDQATAALRAALGPEGTRLCIVESIDEKGDSLIVRLSETICSAGEAQGSPRELTFTMGAIHGAVEVLTGRRLRAKQIESVLRGGAHDVIELIDLL